MKQITLAALAAGSDDQLVGVVLCALVGVVWGLVINAIFARRKKRDR